MKKVFAILGIIAIIFTVTACATTTMAGSRDDVNKTKEIANKFRESRVIKKCC